MVKEWSTWIILIQGSICTLLWRPLTNAPNGRWSLYISWFAFSTSVVIATLLISRVPAQIEKLDPASANRSVLTNEVRVLNRKMTMQKLLNLQHAFFLTGLAFIIIHVVTPIIQIAIHAIRQWAR